MISIKIDGHPIPWKRPAHKKIREEVIVFDKQKKEKEHVRWQLKDQYKGELITVAMFMDFTFYMPVPKAASGKLRTQMLTDFCKPIKRPDLDNLAKFYLDAMTGYIFTDDSQITELNLRKVYGVFPQVLIRIKPYSLNEAPVPSEDDFYDDYM
jgi:Holliday junction resolvase RusA-like endonuclease